MPTDLLYVTTPIYYVNDSLRISATPTRRIACGRAGPVHAARRQVRRAFPHRHGRARPEGREGGAGAAGLDPQAFTDRGQRSAFRAPRRPAMHVSATTTSSAPPRTRHKRACHGALWQRLVAAGEIYLGTYAGWYSVRDEAFYSRGPSWSPDRTGARVAPTGAPGRVGRPSRAISSASPPGSEPAARALRNEPGLHRSRPARRNEMTRFVRGRARRPLDPSAAPASAGASRCRATPRTSIYVWLDALTNYMAACRLSGHGERGRSLHASGRPTSHVVGKDIVRFHTSLSGRPS